MINFMSTRIRILIISIIFFETLRTTTYEFSLMKIKRLIIAKSEVLGECFAPPPVGLKPTAGRHKLEGNRRFEDRSEKFEIQLKMKFSLFGDIL